MNHFILYIYKTKLNLSLVRWSKRCQYLMLVSHDHTYYCSLNIPYLFSHTILITQYFQWNTFCFKMPQYIMDWVQLSYTNYTFYQTVEASWPYFVKIIILGCQAMVNFVPNVLASTVEAETSSIGFHKFTTAQQSEMIILAISWIISLSQYSAHYVPMQLMMQTDAH